jgi:Mrp family chromosome partitioning ATPase/capsular polysaccharide biosynthesis protein
MELSFVIKALQRRWWIIVLFSLLGAIPGSLAGDSDVIEFRSDAALLVSPPTSSTIFPSGDPDRYVQGQLTVLGSQSLLDEVALIIGDDDTGQLVRDLKFKQVGDTDVVVVTSTHPSPERARVVANAFVQTYVATQIANARDSQQPDIDALNEVLREKQEELNQVNATIENAMRVYVLNPPVPPVNAIVPGASSSQQLLVDEINRIQIAQNELDLAGRLRVNTEIIQQAGNPIPVESSNSTLIIGGYVLGAMLGVVVALVWAQFSPYLIDEGSTSDVTGQPTVGTLTRSRVMRTNPLLASQQARGRTPQTLAQLAVRSEALGSVTRPLVIVAIGPRVGAGATTTALAMAGRFSQQGSLVTVLDADDRDRTLSRQHATPDLGGLAELVSCIDDERDVNTEAVLSPTELGSVNVIGQGDELTVLRRANTQAVIQTAAQFGDVLIVDGGPLLGSAAVIEACRHADAIVLSVPLQRQLRSQLSDVVLQLGADRSKLLTVVNEPVAQRFWHRLFKD